MTHSDLVKGVLAKLNEIGYESEVSLLTDISSAIADLPDYIDVALKDAVLRLERVNVKDVSIADGSVTLPDDFVSVVEIKGSTWKRAVEVVAEVGTPEYIMAMNEFTAPGVNNPVAVRDGARDLKILPQTDGVMLYNAAYDGISGITGDKEATMVVNLAAEIVYGIFNEQR